MESPNRTSMGETLTEKPLGFFRKHGDGQTKLVHNAALSQATAVQKPSLLTRNMFLVCPISFISYSVLTTPALLVSIRRNVQLLYQRLRVSPPSLLQLNEHLH